jgi:23S rRNA pseudouridine2457 synthase
VEVEVLLAPPALPERTPAVRFRKSVPDSWLMLTLREGKNRQVRRMTAALGFPTLRLVRWSIGAFTLEGMKPGEVREMPAALFTATRRF